MHHGSVSRAVNGPLTKWAASGGNKCNTLALAAAGRNRKTRNGRRARSGKVEVKYQDKFLTKTVEGRLPGGKAAEMAEGNPPPTVLLGKAKEG